MGLFEDPNFQQSFSEGFSSSYDTAEKYRREEELLKKKIKAEADIEKAKANESAVALQDAFKDDPQVGPVFQKLFSKGADKNTLSIAKTIIEGANRLKVQEEKLSTQKKQAEELLSKYGYGAGPSQGTGDITSTFRGAPDATGAQTLFQPSGRTSPFGQGGYQKGAWTKPLEAGSSLNMASPQSVSPQRMAPSGLDISSPDFIKQVGSADDQTLGKIASQVGYKGAELRINPMTGNVSVSPRDAGVLREKLVKMAGDMQSGIGAAQRNDPNYKASQAGKVDLEKEYIKTSGSVQSAVAGLTDSFDALQKALPNAGLDKYPNAISRIYGTAAVLTADLSKNKELLPVVKRMEGQAYKLARALDPSGRISDKDLQAAVGQIFGPGQSASERQNTFKNLMFDVASTMRPEHRLRLAEENPDLAQGFKQIGIDFVELKRLGGDTYKANMNKQSFFQKWGIGSNKQ